MSKDLQPIWTEELFTISSVKATNPPTYTIKDQLGKPVRGRFYEKELQLSVQKIFRIERVLRKNISKRYAWQSAGNCRENNPLPQSLRGLVIGKSVCGKTTVIFNLLHQPGWLDYNHLYVFGKSLHQQEYKVLRKGFGGGLSTQQISNVFNSQEMLQSPLIAIEKYSGVRNGEIRADFYDDCQNSPDPSALDPTQKNLLLGRLLPR